MASIANSLPNPTLPFPNPQNERERAANYEAQIRNLPYPNPRSDRERAVNFEFTSRNIVGAVWDHTPRRWYIPVGLEFANDPKNPLPGYLPPFFGAAHEYVDDDHGWIEVRHSRRRRARRNRYPDA
jgi:hypothetical protein